MCKISVNSLLAICAPKATYALRSDFVITNDSHSLNGRLQGILECVCIVVCQRGTAELTYDGNTVSMCRNEMVRLVHGHSISDFSVDDCFEGHFLALSKSLAREILSTGHCFVHNELESIPSRRLSKKEMDLIIKYDRLLCDIIEYAGEASFDNIRLMLSASPVVRPLSYDQQHNNSRAYEYINKFMVLLKTNYYLHHNVDYYADCLCISAKYLTFILEKETGLNASDWIKKMLLDDARERLSVDGCTVSMVADELGFSDADVFRKFFIRNVGISPSQFMKRTK